ncbi:hypothetical protein ACIBCO_01280 [Streptomyces violascens]
MDRHDRQVCAGPDPYVSRRTDLIGRTASAPRTESAAPARRSAV